MCHFSLYFITALLLPKTVNEWETYIRSFLSYDSADGKRELRRMFAHYYLSVLSINGGETTDHLLSNKLKKTP